APYRSGYETELRSEIEQGLREGDYQAVFSTNALEIGIDIGRLDACILAGFPDNAFSAWQRIGRVGRSWKKTAYVLFYALNNPFDRFYATNVDTFLDKPLDQILIGVDNEELMERHVPYLMHEIGRELDGEAGSELGDEFRDFVKEQTANTKPVHGKGPGYQKLSIRGGSNRIYTLVANGQEIGTISDVHLFREAYIGAVYNHFGRSYRVVSHGAEEVELESVEPHLQTEGMFYTVVNVDEVLAGFRYAENLEAGYGQLTVIENFGGYRLIDTRTDEILDEVKSESARSFKVRGFWLGLEDPSMLQCTRDPRDLFGLEQLLRIGVPFVVPCDRHDLGNYTHRNPYPSVYLYETVPGGIGVAEKVLEVWDSIIREGQGITERCECRRGCPSCLVPPRIPSGFEPPKKDMAIAIGNELLGIAESGMREQFDPNVHGWRPID
ncbi:MAG: Zn-binding domain-containing protein, partial [Salinibacter sp.]